MPAHRQTSPCRHLHWTPPDPSRPVGIAWLADVHWPCPRKQDAFARDLQTILETSNLYVVLGGDLIDNHIKHLSGMLGASESPAAQWCWLEEFLQRISPKLVAIVSGNHEAWTRLFTGFDPLAWFSSRLLSVPYDTDELAISIKMRGASYLAAIRHKYRGGSSANPALKVKNWWRDGDHDFDVGVVCHDHTAVIEPFVRHSRIRWAVRPGTYQLQDAYSRREGYHGSIAATPVTIFKPGRHDVHAFLHLNWAAEYLKGIVA